MNARPHRAPTRRPRGFTLVEVLVALIVVILGTAALLGTLTSAADSTSYQRDKSLAEWVALNKLTETRLAPGLPPKGTKSGTVDFAGRKFRWEQEVESIDIPGAVKVQVRVAEAKPGVAQDDKAWAITTFGFMGDALAQPTGIPLDWSDQWFQNDPMQPPPNANGGQGNAPPPPAGGLTTS